MNTTLLRVIANRIFAALNEVGKPAKYILAAKRENCLNQNNMKTIALIIAICATTCHAMNAGRLADAIRIEEGNNPRWLYGIHHKGSAPLSEPEARKRCLATIAHAQRDWSGRGDFIAFLASRYCPVNHISWANNVRRIYASKP